MAIPFLIAMLVIPCGSNLISQSAVSLVWVLRNYNPLVVFWLGGSESFPGGKSPSPPPALIGNTPELTFSHLLLYCKYFTYFESQPRRSCRRPLPLNRQPF